MDSEQSDYTLDRRGAENGHSHRGLRAEIAETRREMDQTLDKLGEKLGPRAILDDTLQRWVGPDGERLDVQKVKEAADGILEVMRRNPIATSLVAAGLTLGLVCREGDRRLLERGAESWSTLSKEGNRRSRQIAERAASISTSASGRAHSTWESASDFAHRASDQARRTSDSFQSTVRRTTRAANRNPGLYAVAAGLAGIAVGFLSPSTRTEDQLIGRASDDLKERAKQGAQEVGSELRSGIDTAGIESAENRPGESEPWRAGM